MKSFPRTFRTFLFGAALFFAGALSFWHIRSQGALTGTLQYGGRQSHTVVRAVDPKQFASESTIMLFGMYFFIIFGALNLFLAWTSYKKRKKVEPLFKNRKQV